MNNSSAESKFKVLVNMPSQNVDPLLQDKLHDLLQMCEVDHEFISKKDFDRNPKNAEQAL